MNIDPETLDLATLFARDLGDLEDETWRQGKQYALVELADNALAVDISATSQIFERPQITPVPNTPEWVLGVCNVRGDIFSIVDIRPLLGFQPASSNAAPDPLVILLEGPRFTCGATVQAVSELLRIQDSQIIEPTTEIPYISGLYRRGQDTLMVLDVEALLNSPEMMQFQ